MPLLTPLLKGDDVRLQVLRSSLLLLFREVTVVNQNPTSTYVKPHDRAALYSCSWTYTNETFSVFIQQKELPSL